MKERQIIFLKYSLLEELETTKKGNVSVEQVLTLVNKKKYQLEEAVVFKEKLEGKSGNDLVGKIIAISEIETLGYDLYMDTIIVGECVYRVEEGFKGTLIHENIKEEGFVEKLIVDENEFSKKEKTSEQLLADLMLGNMF